MPFSARDLVLAHRAKQAGAEYALRIIIEARRRGFGKDAQKPLALAFALIEQESDFKNVFGHDAGAWRPDDGVVTHAAVLELLRSVWLGGASNGVGLPQLTYPPFICRAEQRGGAHIPAHQLSVAFEDLASLIDTYGQDDALERYNAGSPNTPKGIAYRRQVQARIPKWHRILTKGD
jgi:hypothetical protein